MVEPRRKLDEYNPQEMAIPEWRLIQRVGADYARETLGAEPGQFYNTITGEVVDELNIIVVDILSGRAKWGEEITSAGPICASLDAKSGTSISGVDCSKCEYRLDTPWSVNAPERRTMCCLNYTILAIDLDREHMPIMIRLHGISALPARQLITQLRMSRALRGEYHKAIINIKGGEKNTPYGTAYVIHPKVTGLVSDDVEIEELKLESQRLLGTPIPLPEARPEDEEPEPLGFTPKGTPFFSEEERDELLASEAKEPPSIAEPAVDKSTAPGSKSEGTEQKEEKPKGKTEQKEIDYDV